MAKRSAHQQKIIRNYYDNRDEIMLQKLGELITELYLAEGKTRQQLWQRAAAALKNLEVPQRQIDHLVDSDDPALLADQLTRLLAKE